jgi:outer membrane protein assembly factor BamB
MMRDPQLRATRRFGRSQGITLGVLVTLLIVSGTAAFIANRPQSIPRQTATASTQTPAGPTQTPVMFAKGNDWPQYRYDVVGTGVNPEETLTSANVAGLRSRWTVKKPQGFFTTPAIVDGVVYAPSGLSLYAVDLLTGAIRWQFDGVAERRGGIHSSVAIDQKRKVAFFGTPEARLYAVDITTGKQRWQIQLQSPTTGAYIWSSPLVVNERVYVGLASANDRPCIRGAVFAIDPDTSQTIWVHRTAPAGLLGGGVWSSLTADPESQTIVATTANPCDGVVYPEEDAFLGLDWNTGETRWSYSVLPYDVDDYGFGEGAVIYTYQGQKYMVAGDKFGKFYAVSPPTSGSTPALAWSRRLADADTGKNGGGIFQPATLTQGLLIVGSGSFHSESPKCVGNLNALRPDTGELVWRICTTDKLIGPAAASGDIIFASEYAFVVAFNALTGNQLWSAPHVGTSWGGVAISHGIVVVPTVSGTLDAYSL